jgi:hypothetical protein
MPCWQIGQEERKSRRYDPTIDPFRYEKHFQEWLRNGAKRLRLLYYHTHNSKNSPAGFLDAKIMRACRSYPRLIVAELKTPWRPNPTPDQRFWLDADRMLADEANEAAGYDVIQVYLWNFEDLDEIRGVLETMALKYF